MSTLLLVLPNGAHNAVEALLLGLLGSLNLRRNLGSLAATDLIGSRNCGVLGLFPVRVVGAYFAISTFH
jgi:hypothetical protein